MSCSGSIESLEIAAVQVLISIQGKHLQAINGAGMDKSCKGNEDGAINRKVLISEHDNRYDSLPTEDGTKIRLNRSSLSGYAPKSVPLCFLPCCRYPAEFLGLILPFQRYTCLGYLWPSYLIAILKFVLHERLSRKKSMKRDLYIRTQTQVGQSPGITQTLVRLTCRNNGLTLGILSLFLQA